MRVLIRSTYVTCVILRTKDCSMETKRKVACGHVICAHVLSHGNEVNMDITKQKNPGWKTLADVFELKINY